MDKPIKQSQTIPQPTPPDKSKIVDEPTLDAYVDECIRKNFPAHVIEVTDAQYEALWGSPTESVEFGMNTRFGLITIKRTPA